MNKIFIICVSFVLFSCTNLSKIDNLSYKDQKKIIYEEFNDLEEKFYFFLENEINEKKIRKLEKKFINLKNQILKIKNIPTKEHQDFLNNYLNLLNIKIQYLRDLEE